MTAQRIIPNIWCDRNAEEAGAFYASVFGGSSSVVGRYPEEGLPDFQKDFAGKAVTVDVEIEGFQITLINAGSEFRPNPTISFLLNVDPRRFGGEGAARARIDEIWGRLSEGGTAMMRLTSYPHSAYYGWIEDRFGVSWQLMLTEASDETSPDEEPAPFIVPDLLFVGPAQSRAREAIDFYTGLFPDSGAGMTVGYPAAQGPANAGDVMFAEFRLAGQPFAAMDSAAEMSTRFDCGVSLEVRCDDQAEIDRLWDALSTVPEAEACGWCADRFGVSWQIVPSNMGELMARPGAYGHMMQMKKLIIADF
ncbi:putative 3-demethylubiquinone-9 3-methyltransferase (glyoxalase superfamily) [Microbacterium resistens]|uniref:3-demethylubiquinone-9 3-methyltransferase (Glyoxalase superfamily) n=1 Tax=Microbacterium resistens TaxID=156977 RepID=A0ABU1SIJ0_9MICO|nr:VOC family protein [Microbacterium resistens]MDR6868823.1 putative 3-demethylubiquinone-9 3-methyltransferase (glyoxalase superfamily) [Microbacterium resistens]